MMREMPSKPGSPYYAVLFASVLRANDPEYSRMAEHLEALARNEEGYLGIESFRDPDGRGISVSYWRSLEDVQRWKANPEHRGAQSRGKSNWYQRYRVRICRVETEYEWNPEGAGDWEAR